MDVIKRGYEDGLIWPGYIHFDEFTEALRLGKDRAFKRVREDMKRRIPDDVHRYISWWACFDPKERALLSRTHVDVSRPKEPKLPKPLPGDKTAKNKAKAARKKAKSAKKKKSR